MGSLGAQFCAELAFGALFALAFVPRAPVGAFFYRLLGTSALVLVAAAGALRWSERGRAADPVLAALALAALAYPVFAGPLRGRVWAAGLGLGLAACTAAVSLLLAEGLAPGGIGLLALATASALATGTVAGTVGVAMVLGHWYLTVPNLGVEHLARLNRVCVASMLGSLAILVAVCVVFAPELDRGVPRLTGPWGLFYLGTRVSVGVLVPLGFAWMTASSLRFRNTRSATGILYASTVLVLIGAAAAVALQDTYGVPL